MGLGLVGALAALAVCPAAIQAGRMPTASAAKAELPRLAQRLLDAVSAGDTTLWARRLAPEAVLTDENGQTRTRAEFLAELRPLPPAVSGTLRVANPQVRVAEAAAVLTYDALEEARYYGQVLRTRYHTTDTWTWRKGRWWLLGSQTQVLPSERAVEVWVPDTLTLRAYVGRYRLAPGTAYAVDYDVYLEGSRLFGRRAGRQREELLPSSPDVFFRRGAPRGERLFVRDTSGRVVRMLDRRDNNDVVWERAR